MYRTAPAPRPFVVSAFNGEVVAYDRASGRTVWRWQAPGLFGHTHVQPTHVAMDGTRVFVLVAIRQDVGMFSTATASVEIAALDDTTGRMLWTQSVNREQPMLGFAATFVVDAGQVVVTCADVILALSAESGQVQWSRPSEHGDGGALHVAAELAVSGETAKPIR